MKIKVDYYDSLPNDKRINLHNVLIPIKLVLNKDKNHYYYMILLGKMLVSVTLKNKHKNFFYSIIMVRSGGREKKTQKKPFMTQKRLWKFGMLMFII